MVIFSLLTSGVLSTIQNAHAFTTGQSASIVIGQPDFFTVTSGSGDNKFLYPHSVAYDSAGNLFVVDSDNHRILRFNAPLTTGMSASLVIGQPDFTTTGFGSANNQLWFPSDALIDSGGNLLVLDGETGRILRFSAPLSNGMSADMVIGGLTEPDGFAFDLSGNLLVADSGANRIVRYNLPLVSGMAPNLTFGTSELNRPHSVTVDSFGNTFVSDQIHNRVLRYNAPLFNGMTANEVIGQPDFVTTTPGLANNKLDSPTDIEVDSSGDLFVSDGFNNRVLRFSAPLITGAVATLVLGQNDFTSSTFGIGANNFGGYVEGLAFDPYGNLLVTDQDNNRILKFISTTPPPISSGTSAVGTATILGTCGLITSGGVSFDAVTEGGTTPPEILDLTNTGTADCSVDLVNTPNVSCSGTPTGWVTDIAFGSYPACAPLFPTSPSTVWTNTLTSLSGSLSTVASPVGVIPPGGTLPISWTLTIPTGLGYAGGISTIITVDVS